MTQKELYEFAKTLDDKQAAYLIASYVEHRGVAEWGFNIKANNNVTVEGKVEFKQHIFS